MEIEVTLLLHVHPNYMYLRHEQSSLINCFITPTYLFIIPVVKPTVENDVGDIEITNKVHIISIYNQ